MTIVQNGKKCESARVNYETLCYIINRLNAYNLSAFITLQRKNTLLQTSQRFKARNSRIETCFHR